MPSRPGRAGGGSPGLHGAEGGGRLGIPARASPPRGPKGLDGRDPSGVLRQRERRRHRRRHSGFISGVAGSSPREGVAEAPEVGLKTGEDVPRQRSGNLQSYQSSDVAEGRFAFTMVPAPIRAASTA